MVLKRRNKNTWCHNPIFYLFILIILFTEKNDEKQVKINK